MNWWQPGMSGGLLSRRWAQAHVFPLPELKREELEASLKFKAQALLPSDDLALKTRLFRHRGKLFGLVLVDRLPAERPSDSQLTLGMPLLLPKNWPAKVLLAVETPDGWELHRYEDHLLRTSYPPLAAGSSGLARLMQEHAGFQFYWHSPEEGRYVAGPEGFDRCPDLPASQKWGIPWEDRAEPKWPAVLWVLAVVLVVVGWGGGAWLVWDAKAQQNDQWSHWLKQAQRQVTGISQANADKVRAQDGGVPLEGIFSALAQDWGEGIAIQKAEINQEKLVLTVRSHSALAAVAALSKDRRFKNVKVLEIRPGSNAEEFDLEGEWNYDQ
jgi:hypothetical protein